MTDFDNSLVPDRALLTGARHSASNNSVWEKRRAVRSVAHHAESAVELAELLDMLGLDASSGVTRRAA